MSCVRSLVAVMWQGSCRGCSGASPEIGEHRARIVAVLLAQSREIDAAAVDARRRAGLQAADAQGKLAQPRGQTIRGRIAGAAARHGSRGRRECGRRGTCRPSARRCAPETRCRSAVTQPATRSPCSVRSATSCWNSCRFGWVSSSAADGALVQLPVGLRARGAHRRSLAGIQGAELDAGAVGRQRHRAAQRIDLLDQMALADAADGRIAAHLARASRCCA